MAVQTPSAAESFHAVLDGLQQFRQIILYGPPGTGKTLLAQRLALTLLAEDSFGTVPTGALSSGEQYRFEELQKDGQLGVAVMHAGFGYERFVIGFPVPAEPNTDKVVRAFKCMHCTRLNKVRVPGPASNHTRLERGIFWRMCKQAEKRPAVLILDEIHRTDVAHLLGDLLYALEYRDRPVVLPFEYREGSDGRKTRHFKVPRNLYIVGTMNTADRSLPPLDVVVKRRFGLFQVEPDPEVVRAFWQNRDPKLGRQLLTLMKRMNDALAKKEPEGDLRVGHAYFLADADLRDPMELRKQVARKWEHQVHQLLVDYDRVLHLGADFFKRFPRKFE